MKRALKISAIVATVLVGLPLALWALLPVVAPGLIRDQARQFGEKIGYRIEVGDIELAPFALRARLHDLRLAPTQGDALLTLKAFEADARFLPLLKGRLEFDRIVLDEPAVLLARPAGLAQSKTPAWNWEDFVARIQALGTHDQPKSQSNAAIPFRIDDLALNAGRVSVHDGLKKSTLDLGPLNLRLTDLSNQDDAGHVGGASLSSRYALNLGSVKLPLPPVDGTPERHISFGKVTAVGEIVENSAAALRVALDLTLDAAQIHSTWQLADGALAGKATVSNLAVSPLLALAPTVQPLESPSGVINGGFELKQDAAGQTIDGDIKIDQLDIREPGAKQPLLAWTTMSFSRFHLALPKAEDKATRLTMNEILLDAPKLRLILDTQRQSNFGKLFGGAKESSNAPAKNPPAAKAAPGFRYDIRNIYLKNGFMYFADESIKPNFRVDVTELNGAIQGISNEPDRNASLVFNGRAAKTGGLRVRGQLGFADPRQNNDVRLNFRNIPLDATNPYVMTFAGYAIDDGRIDVDLRYLTKAGQLQGDNHFVIKKLKLGDEVADYQGTRLPLRLAVALLEDADGIIDVDIPVSGNINSPEFSVGHLVWQAVKTVLANVVSAPFRALGALFGIEHMDSIGFVPGESALPPEDDEQLGKMASLLAKRPKASLAVHGTYDPSVDAKELARAMADRAILQASGLKLVAGEPLPLPNLTDPKVKAGLRTAYAAQVGRIKLAQRLLTLPDNADRDIQLRQELIQSYPIGDEQLRQLASQRANAVKARLLAVDKTLGDRVLVSDPETASVANDVVPLKVDMQTGN